MVKKQNFDIIVPVYNSPNHARVCLESVYKEVTESFELVVINDKCDPYTTDLLKKIIAPFKSNTTLIEHSTNLGYLKSVNEGINARNGEIVILLNSDATLSPGALERIRKGFDSDPKIGVISAVSTWANWTRIPFPSGTNRNNLVDLVREFGEEDLAEIGNASGFFFAVRRKLYEELGVFDEVYSPGYWEEADFCMKAIQAGYKVMVDRKLYIFHHGWGSFQKNGRDENMNKNKSIFMNRWEEQFKQIELDWRNKNPVEGLITKLNKKHTPQQPTDRLRICFLKQKADKSDFTISLIQMVNGLVNEGIDANIVFFEETDESFFNFTPMYFRPLIIDEINYMDGFPMCDIIVATETTVFTKALSVSKKQTKVTISFLAFELELDRFKFGSEEYRQAELAYQIIEHKIASTAELAKTLSLYGNETLSVGPLANEDIFYPLNGSRKHAVICHLDLEANREQLETVINIYTALANRIGEIELGWFGSLENIPELPSSVHYLGNPSKMNELARLYNESIIYLECSGLDSSQQTCLNAMACGTIPAIRFEMANTSICKHLVNSLLIDTKDVYEILDQIAGILDNKEVANQVSKNALETANKCTLQGCSKRLASFYYEIN